MAYFSIRNLPWNKNDGGRAEAGYKGSTRDCVIRSIAIATGKPYKEVYKAIYDIAKANPMWRQRRNPAYCSPRTGVYHEHYKAYLETLGWEWVDSKNLLPSAGVGAPMKVSDFPDLVILEVPRHLVTMIDGVIQDTFCPKQLKEAYIKGMFVKRG